MQPHEPLSEEEYQKITDDVVLPSWMDFPDPEKDIYVIDSIEGKFVVRGSDKTFDFLEQAYDYVDSELDGIPDMTGIPNVHKLQITENRRLLLAFLPSERLRLTKYNYWHFLQLNKEYQLNPEDFVLSYHWLSEHPAFYYRVEGHLNHWVQEMGLDEVASTVYQDNNGSTVVALEHGAKVDPNRVGAYRYLDYRLESRAETFEKAYIALAKAVNKHFTIEGEDRGLDDIVPQWLQNVVKVSSETQEE